MAVLVQANDPVLRARVDEACRRAIDLRTAWGHRLTALRATVDQCRSSLGPHARLSPAWGVTASVALGEALVDAANLRIHRGDGRLTLTPTEWRVLNRLLQAHGGPVAKAEIAESVFGLRHERQAEVEVYISRLRKKLGGQRESAIATVPGGAYRACITSAAGEPQSKR